MVEKQHVDQKLVLLCLGNVQRGVQVQNFSPNININVNPPRPPQVDARVDASPTKSSGKHYNSS